MNTVQTGWLSANPEEMEIDQGSSTPFPEGLQTQPMKGHDDLLNQVRTESSMLPLLSRPPSARRRQGRASCRPQRSRLRRHSYVASWMNDLAGGAPKEVPVELKRLCRGQKPFKGREVEELSGLRAGRHYCRRVAREREKGNGPH